MIINPYSFATGGGGGGLPYYDEVIDDSPDSYWRLEETTGDDFFDEMGAYTGANANIPGTNRGIAGALSDGTYCVNFGGDISRRIICGGAGNYTSSDFSIEFWVNAVSFASTSGVNYSVIIFKGQFDVEGYVVYIETNGRVNFVTNQSGASQTTSTATSAVATGAWYHIVITRAGAVAKIYINGSDATNTSGSHTNPASASGTNFQIGEYVGWSFTPDAKIDEVAIYSTALSAARVSAHYNAA